MKEEAIDSRGADGRKRGSNTQAAVCIFKDCDKNKGTGLGKLPLL